MRERSGLERELEALGLREQSPDEREFESVFGRLMREGKEKLGGMASALMTLAHRKRTLMTSREGQEVDAHIFPGTSDRRALIISGVHGSELSGIQVAERLVMVLRGSPRPFFNVVVVPCLFPDNAAVARCSPQEIGSKKNIGRKTNANWADPNRQFPKLGTPFDAATRKDAKGRVIEPENIALLTLIEQFKPERIASIHSHRTPEVAGIYADPRTDATGLALGFGEDKELALAMARLASAQGAKVPGNLLDTTPNAVYPLDPPVVPAGQRQRRVTSEGISLGGWGTTAVIDPANPARSRPPMTVITIEVQSSKRIQDYRHKDPAKQQSIRDVRRREYNAHVMALQDVFLASPDRVTQ